MPRYFFHVRSGADFVGDNEGQECSDLSTAVTEAIMVAREIVSQRLRTGLPIDLHGEILIQEGRKAGRTSVSFSVALAANVA